MAASSRLELVTPPAVEPVSLAEAKLHLRVEIDDDDSLITGLITAARQKAELDQQRSLIATTWDWFLDGFAYGGGYYNRAIRAMGPDLAGAAWLPGWTAEIFLPRPPLMSVTAIEYRDSNGNFQTMDPADYQVSTGTQGKVAPAYGKSWPNLQPGWLDPVKIRFVAGYGSTADAVPESTKLGMKLLIGNWYENRESVQPVNMTELPQAVTALFAAEEWGSYPGR